MLDLSKYSCDKCKREGSWHCKHCWHTADKPPTRFKRKKKTGCETPTYSRFSMAPNPNLGWQPTKSSGTKPPKPPTSGSNAVKPNPNYIPPASTPRYNPPPMPPIKPAKEENKIMNKTMYGLNLYIPFEELDTYIHERVDKKYKDQTFIPVKVEINEIGLGIDITLLSASSVEIDNCRYKLDLNALPKESTK